MLSARLEVLDVSVPENINLVKVVDMFKERAITINDMADSALFLFNDINEYAATSVKKVFKQSAIVPLETLIQKMTDITDWDNADLHGMIEDTVSELEVGFGKVGQPLRVALTGQSSGPANDEIMKVLGKDESIKRANKALEVVKEKVANQRN